MVIPESKIIFITSGMCLHRILHQFTLTLNAIDLFIDEKVLCIGSEKEMQLLIMKKRTPELYYMSMIHLKEAQGKS